MTCLPIFSSGSNCCPADHFVPRVTNEKDRKLLEIFVRANQTMIRQVKCPTHLSYSVADIQYLECGAVVCMRKISFTIFVMSLGSWYENHVPNGNHTDKVRFGMTSC